MAIHESRGKSDEWYTPKYIFNALGVTFDMDVASPEIKTFVPAKQFITEDSLSKTWNGFIWMNPPFGNQRCKFEWINKFIDYGDGIALFPDRTSAPWWQYLANNSDAVLFVNGKIKFHKPDGSTGDSPGNGTTLFAIGEKGIESLQYAAMNTLGMFYRNER